MPPEFQKITISAEFPNHLRIQPRNLDCNEKQQAHEESTGGVENIGRNRDTAKYTDIGRNIRDERIVVSQ